MMSCAPCCGGGACSGAVQFCFVSHLLPASQGAILVVPSSSCKLFSVLFALVGCVETDSCLGESV